MARQFKEEETARKDFEARQALVFWRGTTTGRKTKGDELTNKRIQFCMESLKYPSCVDAKISRVGQFRNNRRTLSKLKRYGITAPRVPESEFARYMATIDLDGNVSAWGTLRKYLMLVHVIKPESAFEMFYHVGQPLDTFTRVSGTNEFFQRIEREEQLADCFQTAWKGYVFAHGIRERIKAGEATVYPE